MPLAHTACTHCGHWHLYFANQTPPQCLVCSDVRNALPEDGWDFASTQRVADLVVNEWTEAMPGIWGVTTRPAFGLGATGWVIQHEAGNVGFEATAYYHPDALEFIASLGGIRTLSCSHPHGMGALWMLQRHFTPQVVIHRDGVPFTKAFRVTWPADDVHEIADGLTLHHIGGHYEGQMVLYDAARRALFAGDALKIDFDAQGRAHALSCHKGFHYGIPLSHAEIAHYREVFAQLAFEHVFTPFEHAAGITRDHALALFDRLLKGAPTARPIPLESL
ncbi:MAG TPA: MBL fold metallo-hydrolase [Burkholderiaceae bacterium]|nr:MBL fold metallo-hydrolase [Burkholderiaceae bacterium]